MRFRKFPTATIVLLIVLGWRFSSLLMDLASFQSEGNHREWYYNQYYSPLSLGISNVSTLLMNGGRPSIQKLLAEKVLANDVSTRGRSDHHDRRSIIIPTRRPRILMGVSTKDYLGKAERQHRRIIRDTWLDPKFHKGGEGGSDESHSSVCSLHELLRRAPNSDPDDCQLVYTFLFPTMGNRTTNMVELLDTYGKYRKEEEANGESLASSLTNFPESKHDAIFFSVDNPKNNHEVLVQWIQSTRQLLSQTRIGTFDYVAFATTQALVFPQRLWNENNDLFQAGEESVVAGMHKDGQDEPIPESNFRQACGESFCLDPNFLFLSKDMVQHLATTVTTPAPVETDTEMDTATMALIHLFHLFQQYERNTGKSIVWKQLLGVRRASKSPEQVMSTWDKYIATITDYRQFSLEEHPHAPVTTYQGNPRMLVGIFTTNLRPLERKRRDALRETFVKSYDHTSTPNRICSLQQLLSKEVPEDECQLAYTFVIGGGNKKAPMVNVDANSTAAMVIPGSQINDPEKDVLYLNIQENMNDGKSETWFKYAALLSENQLYFDYITKMDTDTILFPYPLFEKMSEWPKYPNNVHIYGGNYVVKQDALQRTVTVVGTTYMDGPMYWLSPDMARFISDPTRCNHTELRTHAEDMSIGNYVNSFPYPIHRLRLSIRCYAHPLKNLEHYRKRWKRYKKKFRKFHP